MRGIAEKTPGRLHAAFAAALLVLLPAAAQAAPVCTLIVDVDSGAVVHEDGSCDERNSPASTFKLALAVMGYDAGILVDAHTPVWPYRPEYAAWRENWKTAIDPTAWLRDSVVWYSQVLTRALGAERFQRYVDRFDYGDRDLSGDPGKGNGLTQAWLSSSLQVSPREQVAFMRRLLKRQLPATAEAQDRTIEIATEFAAGDGWTVKGKTGTGSARSADGARDEARPFGWFVGWAVKGERRVAFARLAKEEKGFADSAGPHTRDLLLAELPNLLGNSAERRSP